MSGRNRPSVDRVFAAGRASDGDCQTGRFSAAAVITLQWCAALVWSAERAECQNETS